MSSKTSMLETVIIFICGKFSTLCDQIDWTAIGARRCLYLCKTLMNCILYLCKMDAGRIFAKILSQGHLLAGDGSIGRGCVVE